jgi:ribosome-associated protein
LSSLLQLMLTSHRILTTDIIAHELEFATSRSSGPGGQNVNKVNTKVTLRWNIINSSQLTVEEKELLQQKLASRLTTDGTLLITSQDKRSQLQNNEEALLKLENFLKQAFAKRKKRKASKPSKSSVQNRLDKKKKHSDKKKWRQNKE